MAKMIEGFGLCACVGCSNEGMCVYVWATPPSALDGTNARLRRLTDHAEDVPPMTLAEAVDDERRRIKELEDELDAVVEEARTLIPGRRQAELLERSEKILQELESLVVLLPNMR